ncbi:MAG TPA: FAD-dependent oxidoreductase, partial [Actinomycetota bacterium]|nr:FAD-dependent oxidoreductase [Actinomycetota bacterium]
MPDVIIVGAGITGTSIAFHLATRSSLGVLLVDRAGVAEGGTGRSSALIRMHYTFPPEVRLALRSL